MYPETATLKSTRRTGSGDHAQNSTGHGYSGFALNERHEGTKASKKSRSEIKSGKTSGGQSPLELTL
jgi:hypothetical protein